jgi:hypothetical protein
LLQVYGTLIISKLTVTFCLKNLDITGNPSEAIKGVYGKVVLRGSEEKSYDTNCYSVYKIRKSTKLFQEDLFIGGLEGKKVRYSAPA